MNTIIFFFFFTNIDNRSTSAEGKRIGAPIQTTFINVQKILLKEGSRWVVITNASLTQYAQLSGRKNNHRL